VTVNCWLSMYMQLCCDGRRRARRAECLGQSDPSFIFPQYSGLAFVQTSQLVDLCMLDEGSLKFAYSILAATALYYMFTRELSLSVSGNIVLLNFYLHSGDTKSFAEVLNIISSQ
jgi:cyclin E